MTNTPNEEPTDEQINALIEEAAEAGDIVLVRVCREALAGGEEALRQVKEALRTPRTKVGP